MAGARPYTASLVEGRDPGCVSNRRFTQWLVILTLVGIAIRLLFAVVTSSLDIGGDSLEFQEIASNLVAGNGYTHDFLNQGAQATAQHPPLFPLLVAALRELGMASLAWQRAALAVITSLSIPLMGLLGRQIRNARVGLFAAGIAAVDPLWVQPSGVLMSESTYLVIVPLVLLLATRCVRAPSRVRMFALGIAIGLATLNRSEAFGLLVILGVPTILFAYRHWRDRLVASVVVIAAVAISLGPWLVRNQQQLGVATLSTNTGNTVIGAYCEETFKPGQYYGAYFVGCAYGGTGAVLSTPPPDGQARWGFATMDARLVQEARGFASDHASQLPAIMTVRVLRLWGFWDPGYQFRFDVREGRNAGFQRVGWIMHYLLLALGAVGARELWRRDRRMLLVLGAPLLLVTATAALLYGSTRLRALGEPSLAVLAAVGVSFVQAKRQSVRGRGRHAARR